MADEHPVSSRDFRESESEPHATGPDAASERRANAIGRALSGTMHSGVSLSMP